MTICPCKECETRGAGCHARCSAYKEWKTEQNEIRKTKFKFKSEEAFFTEPRKHRCNY